MKVQDVKEEARTERMRLLQLKVQELLSLFGEEHKNEALILYGVTEGQYFSTIRQTERTDGKDNLHAMFELLFGFMEDLYQKDKQLFFVMYSAMFSAIHNTAMGHGDVLWNYASMMRDAQGVLTEKLDSMQGNLERMKKEVRHKLDEGFAMAEQMKADIIAEASKDDAKNGEDTVRPGTRNVRGRAGKANPNTGQAEERAGAGQAGAWSAEERSDKACANANEADERAGEQCGDKIPTIHLHIGKGGAEA
jgi:hypothetical protein